METCIEYTDLKQMYFSTDEAKWIKYIRSLEKEYPKDIRIIRQPEDNDGCLYCSVPVSWLKIKPKKTRDMSDEEREALRERMQAMREKRVNA